MTLQKPHKSIMYHMKYIKNFRSVYYYANKAIRNPKARRVAGQFVRNFVPKAESLPVSQEEMTRLKSDGLIILDQLIDAATVTKIRDYLRAKPVYDLSCDYTGATRIPLSAEELKNNKRKKLGYFEKDLLECKEIVDIANSKKILGLVSEYLGCKPTITALAAWWSMAGDDSSQAFYDDTFHRDADDYKFIKLFVYLTDIEAENGAHAFIRGSHASSDLVERKPLSDEEVARHFDKKDYMILSAKSGTGILEDTWGIHRSMPCVKGERLLLQFLYSLTANNAQAIPKPIVKNTYNVDPHINRVYLY